MSAVSKEEAFSKLATLNSALHASLAIARDAQHYASMALIRASEAINAARALHGLLTTETNKSHLALAERMYAAAKTASDDATALCHEAEVAHNEGSATLRAMHEMLVKGGTP